MLARAFTIAQKPFGDTSVEMAEACNNLGMLSKYSGRFDEGLRMYRRALDAIIPIEGEQ